ncbi:MAG: hypothetical protein JJ992_01220, partial [Planctomycetes bacterium]|nr:hypothetical protein [Planctomycetota bacterium]
MTKKYSSLAGVLAASLAGLLALSPGVFGEEAIDVEPLRLSEYNLPGLDTKVNLTSVEPMNVVQLIEFLAHRGGINNLVIGRGVEGTTTKLKFDDVTVADALETVLAVNQLAYEVRGGILTIMTDAEYQEMHGRSFYDTKRTRIMSLKYADPSRIANMLAPVKSPAGIVVSDPLTGSLVIVDTPEKIRQMEAIVDRADIATVSRVIPTETKTYVLQYASIQNMQSQIQDLLTTDVGTLRADERTKTLVVSDLPHKLEKISNLVKLFDRRPRQVFIEAKVVEVRLEDTYSMGIDWQQVFDGIDPRFRVEASSKPTDILDPTFNVSYSTIAAGGDLSLVLNALKNVGETKILSNPHIACLDGQEAKIEVVEDQPYKETQLEAGTTNITGETFLFTKVGVQLGVTPRINEEDMILVDVRPEISSISTWYDGAPQEGTPVVKQAITETTIIVKDGVTIIIGGLIQDRKDETTRSVPFLGEIPLLGRFFRHEATQSVNTETVVFLTPRIMTGDEPQLQLKDERKAP